MDGSQRVIRAGVVRIASGVQFFVIHVRIEKNGISTLSGAAMLHAYTAHGMLGKVPLN